MKVILMGGKSGKPFSSDQSDGGGHGFMRKALKVQTQLLPAKAVCLFRYSWMCMFFFFFTCHPGHNFHWEIRET